MPLAPNGIGVLTSNFKPTVEYLISLYWHCLLYLFSLVVIEIGMWLILTIEISERNENAWALMRPPTLYLHGQDSCTKTSSDIRMSRRDVTWHHDIMSWHHMTSYDITMHLVASVRLSFRPRLSKVRLSLSVRELCLCVCNQRAFEDNVANAVDRLLIYPPFWWLQNIEENYTFLPSMGLTQIHIFVHFKGLLY